MIWSFRLQGKELDRQTIKELFKESIKFGVDDGHDTLVMVMPIGSSEVRDAIGSAEELLSKLNGIAHAQYRNHENVKIDAVASQERPESPLDRYIIVPPATARMRMGAPIITVDGVVPSNLKQSIGDLFLEAADKDKNFDRAIYLYGCLAHDWRGLYMVLEAAEDGNGGEGRLIDLQWVPDGTIKKFKATANSFKALSMQARHGSIKTGISEATLTLDEAQTMIRTLIERWGKELSELAE